MKENKNSKKIGSSLLQESLIDYNNLANKLNDSTPEIIKNLLGEQVKQAYANLLNESDEDDIEDTDYDVEEVNDTASEPAENSETTEDAPAIEDGEEGMESEESNTTDVDTDVIDTVDNEDEDDFSDEEDDMSADFEDYKVEGSDNEYDFRNAQDDEIVKVYKRLTNDDNVTVVKNNDKINISDNETGAEYLIDLESNDDSTSDELLDDNINTDDMNESRIFEIALNEYDSHVGYTDNYQKKDVMTTDGVSEPGKGRDIDNGVPKTTSKPWSKQKKSVAPFNGGKGQTVECGGATGDIENPEVAENVTMGSRRAQKTGIVPGNRTTPKNVHGNKHTADGPMKDTTNEAIQKKVEKIFNENKQLKAELNNLTKILKEAAVTNVNLGGIIKLISENSTSKDEKKNIINRFTNEAHTVEESKNLYARINEELKQKPQNVTNINEEKQYSNVNSNENINESKLYQDDSLMDSLGLMHRICK